jgi:membrane fusion protein (multidrug efflux system)
MALLGLALHPACRRAQQAPPPPPPIVQVSKPLQRDVPIVAQAIAQTEAIANVEVRARVEATVEKILFVEGTSVKEGDPLFVLDRKPIEQRLAAAKGNLGQLEANLQRVTQDVERLRPLAGRGAVSKADLDTAVANQKQAEAALETGRAQVRAAELDLGYTEVAAPVSGVIGAKQVDVGSLVGKGQPTVMATISPLDPIWANLEVSEVAYLNNAERFKEAESTAIFALVLANGEPHPHLGRLAFVDRVINSTTGTLKIRVEFPNPAKILRPGQFCHVRVLSRILPNALLLPQRAVQELQGQHNVFVVGADGRAAFRRVTMGRRIGSLWIVESGLTADDNVIIEGVLKARDGAPVNAQPGTIDDASLRELEATVPGASKPDAASPPTALPPPPEVR